MHMSLTTQLCVIAFGFTQRRRGSSREANRWGRTSAFLPIKCEEPTKRRSSMTSRRRTAYPDPR